MMKDKIRQILREETSGFDPKMLKALYQYMNFLTKDYVWYLILQYLDDVV